MKYFTDGSKAGLRWILYFFVLCLLCLCARLLICALWSPVGKGLTSLLSFVVSNCEFVTFPLVSWVRCGTLIFPQTFVNIFYKTHTNQNGTGILIKNSRVYRTRAELTQADLTQADLTQGGVEPHLLGKGWPLGSCVWCLIVIFVTNSCGVLGQVWYLIALIPDLCRISYFTYLQVIK